MERKRLLELAGVTLNEMVSGETLQQLTHTIFQLAEEQGYDDSSENRLAVSHDQILKNAQDIIKTLEDGVSDLIRQEFENR